MSGVIIPLRGARSAPLDEFDLVVEAKCECICARAELCVACRCCSACCSCIGGALPALAVQLTLVERGTGGHADITCATPMRTVDQVEELLRAQQRAAFEARIEVWAAQALARIRRSP